MARVSYDEFDKLENLTLILQNKNFENVGNIVKASDITYKENFDSANELSFNVYKKDNQKFWNSIVDFKVLYVPQLKERFEITVSLTEDDSEHKSVTATSLCESELSQITLRNIEINTESDISRDDYDENIPTLFYRDNIASIDWVNISNGKYKGYTDAQKLKVIQNASLLNRILEKAPHYKIGHVDPTLKKIQREFSISETDIYGELTGEISQEFHCLFVFDSMTRTVNVYDLYDGCNACGHRDDNLGDKCHKCGSTDIHKGYGEDTTIYISRENLASETTVETNKDSLKNAFYIEGGDDVINTAIRANNPNGSQYIYYFSDDVKSDMPEELVQKLAKYEALQKSYETAKCNLNGLNTAYNKVVDYVNARFKDDVSYSKLGSDIVGYENTTLAFYEAIDLYSFVNDGMMPTIKTEHMSLDETLANIINGFKEGFVSSDGSKIFANEIAILNAKTASKTTINRAVQKAARLFYSDAYYSFDISDVTINKSSTPIKWNGKITVTSRNEQDESTGEYLSKSSALSLSITDNNTELYIEQSIYRAITDLDTLKESDITSIGLSDSSFKSHIELYSLTELGNLASAFQSCLDVIIASELDDEALYNKYYNFYNTRLKYINAQQTILEGYLENVKAIYYYDSSSNLSSGAIYQWRKNVADSLNLKKFLGETLWKVFNSYIREDNYSNSNYISTGLDNSGVVKRANELIDVASKELYKAGNLQYSITTNMNNILALKDFQKVADKFTVGNWLHIRTGDDVKRIRLLSYQVNFDDKKSISVELSTVEKIWSGVSDIESVIDSARSMSTSYDSVVNQVQNTESTKNKVDDWIENGFDGTKTKFASSENQDLLIDNHGLLARKYDSLTDSYDDCQVKVLSNGLYITKDAWNTIEAGIGKISYTDPETGEEITDFGLIAKTVIGKLILGENLGIYNKDGSVKLNGDGVQISKGKISWDTVHDSYIKSSDYNDLSKYISDTNEFNKKVQTALTGSSTTEIGSDYVVSPKIGGGYLYITNDSDKRSVKIDPKEVTSADGTGNIFEITNKDGETSISADSNGNAHFSGSIDSGNGSFVVDSNGNLTASKVNITGGKLTLGDSFSVSKNGNLIAKKAEITGNVTTTKFVAYGKGDAIKTTIYDGMTIDNIEEDSDGGIIIKSEGNSMLISSGDITFFDGRNMNKINGSIYSMPKSNLSDNAIRIGDSNFIVDKNILSGTALNTGTRVCSVYNDTNNVQIRTMTNAGLYHEMESGYKEGCWLVYINTEGSIKVNTTSDKRMKNYISDLSENDARILLTDVKPITFTYKSDKKGLDVTDGFYAQDFRDVLLKNGIGYKSFLLIHNNNGDEDSYDLNASEDDVNYGIDYSKLTPILWKGWQMHEEEIQKLKSENEDLKNRLKRLEEIVLNGKEK